MSDATITTRTRPRDLPVEQKTSAWSPLWRRITLGVVMLISLFMEFYQLGQKGIANSFYAAGVRSMLDSWHNFFFVSYDPGGFVTLDKPALGFWLQTISAKIFGFSGFSVYLPEALSALFSVLILYHLVRRHFGVTAGLLAALALALSPISVVTSRNNTIDSSLVLCMLLGAWAVLKAAETGKLRWLLLCAVAIGLGYNIKMTEVFLVVPAFGLLYLLAAPKKLWTRIWHLMVALLVMLVIALSWSVVVDLTPASQRPYVGSSQDNSEISLALNYNGIDRILGFFRGSSASSSTSSKTTSGSNNSTGSTKSSTSTGGGSATATKSSSPPSGGSATGTKPGTPPSGGSGTGSNLGAPPSGGSGTGTKPSSPPSGGSGTGNTKQSSSSSAKSGTGTNGNGQTPGGSQPAGGTGGGSGSGLGTVGPLRLFTAALGGQIAWLLPFALLAILALAWQRRPRFREDREQMSLVLWGIWLLTMGVFFSVANFFHQYYLSAMAPAVAALFGIGVVVMWNDYRRVGWRGWLLPIALIATALEQIYIITSDTSWGTWLIPIIAIACFLSAVILVVVRLFPQVATRFTTNERRTRFSLQSVVVLGLIGLMAVPAVWSATPVLQNTQMDLPIAGSSANIGLGGAGGNTSVDKKLISYLESHQGNVKYLVAVPSSTQGDAIILATNKPVMAVGGFGGSDPILTVAKFKALLANGTVRYFLSSSDFGGGGNINTNDLPANIKKMIEERGGSVPSGGTGTSGGGFGGNQSTLSTWVTKNCSTVSTNLWQSSSNSSNNAGGFAGGMGSSSQTLYDCATLKTK